MSTKEAIENVEISFVQLEFAIKLLSFCEMGHLDHETFDTDHLITLEDGNIHFPSGNFSDHDKLMRAAAFRLPFFLLRSLG